MEGTDMNSDLAFDRFVSMSLDEGKTHVRENGRLLPVILTVGVDGKVGIAAVDPQCNISDSKFAAAVLRLIEVEDACMYLVMTQVQFPNDSHAGQRSAAIMLQAYHQDGRRRTVLAPFYQGTEGVIFLDDTATELAPDMIAGAFKNPFAMRGTIG
jgi:hypothetical protein